MLLPNKLSNDEHQVINNELYKVFNGISKLSSYLLQYQNLAGAQNPINEPIDSFINGPFAASFALGHVTVANYVLPNMTTGDFIRNCADAYGSWPGLSAKSGAAFNIKLFGGNVKKHLFENNQNGWNKYKAQLIKLGFQRFTE